MKVSFDLMIRGDGAAYYQISCTDCSTPEKLYVRAHTNEGNLFPISLIPLKKTDLTTTFVIVSPLFASHALTLELLHSGDIVWKKTITKDQLKWTSRFSYRLKKQEAALIRGIDRIQTPQSLNVLPLYFYINQNLNGCNEYVLKALASMPEDCNDLVIHAVDGQGNHIDSSVSLFCEKQHTEFNNGQVRLLQSFTARLPCDDKTYIFYYKNQNTGNYGFLCLNPTEKKHLEQSINPYCYKIAWQNNYLPWYTRRALQQVREPLNKTYPKISIVVPLYKTPPVFFNQMIESVLNQTYQNWELILVNASPEDTNLHQVLQTCFDSRIKIVELVKNLGIAENTNAGIIAATGDFIGLLDHDDLLAPTALAEYARAIIANPSINVLYCDEDNLLNSGVYANPRFKSDFNIDLLRTHNYITHFLVVRAKLLQHNLLNKEFDGAQDYDLILRLSEQTEEIYHIPEVLYHWRAHEQSTAASAESKPYADDAGRRALADHLMRLNIPATVSSTPIPHVYKVDYDIIGNPLVSIIIPNKDHVDILKQCIDSIINKTSYANYEILIVENNSTQQETFDYYQTLKGEAKSQIRILYWKDVFNYSAINNFAAAQAQGDYLLLLNNDTEVISSDWLTSLVSLCQRNDVGIAGAKLLYPDNTIQHAGVAFLKAYVSDEVGGPIHVFANLDKDDPAYERRAIMRQDLSAVTGACLLTKKEIFDAVGGLDENYRVAYNDVDFCLKVREAGYLVVFDPYALLYHYESLSRGSDGVQRSEEDYARFIQEQSRLRERWSMYYAKGDPYHSFYIRL